MVLFIATLRNSGRGREVLFQKHRTPLSSFYVAFSCESWVFLNKSSPCLGCYFEHRSAGSPGLQGNRALVYSSSKGQKVFPICLYPL